MNRSLNLSRLLHAACILGLIAGITSLSYAQTSDYNIRIGDLLMDFSAHVSYSYNDNVTAISKNTPDAVDPTIIGPRSDFLLSYGADMDVRWQITNNNSLGATLGIIYHDYRELDYLDSRRTFFSINPDSELDFTVLAGPVEAKVYGRIGYRVDGSNSAIVSPVESDPIQDGEGRDIIRGRSIEVLVDRYAAWTAEYGVEMLAVLNPLEWTVGIRRYHLMPDDNDGGEFVDQLGRPLETDRWEFTRRTEWMLDSQLYYPLGRDNGFGIFGSYSENDYIRDILADSKGWRIGAVADWAVGERTTLSATVGYDYREFDKANTLRFVTGEFADIVSGKNLFYSASLLNLLGEYFNHKVSFTRQIGYGRVTNEQVTDTIAWDFLFEGIRRIDVAGGVQWINAKESGPFLYAEDYGLFMANLGFTFDITTHLNSSINLRYVDKSSDDDDRSFKQTLASISLRYDF